MKMKWTQRFISLTLVLLLTLTGSAGLAEHITSGGKFVPTYWSQDTGDPSGYSVRVENENATNVGGWYAVMTSGGQAWVPAGQVTVVQATEEPTASPEPTPTPDPNATPTPIPTATITPTPMPAEIIGDKDTTFKGIILSFTVPTGSGGLWLYTDTNSSSKGSEVIPEGQTVKMTSTVYATTVVTDEDGNPVSSVTSSDVTWYECLYKSRLYYVPAAALYGQSATSVPTGSIRSITINGSLGDDDSYEAWYYDAYTRSDRWGNAVGKLAPGRRINARYFDEFAYSFSVTESGTVKTYYIKVSDTVANSASAAEVVDSGDVNLVTRLTIKGPAIPEDPSDPDTPMPENLKFKLYRTPANNLNDYYELDIAPGKSVTLNAQNDIEGWYKVSYRSEYFYVKKSELDALAADQKDSSQVANNNTVETATFYVTIGVNGAKLYQTSSPGTVFDPPYAEMDLLPGATVRVGNLNTTWYTYSADGVTYFLNRKDTSGYSTATDAVSAYKLKLFSNTKLYDRMGTSTTTIVTTDLLKFPLTDDGGTTYYNYYVVYSVNETYFSLEIGGKTYYIQKSDLDSKVNEANQIASVTGGRTYTVTIGGMSAILYVDAACQNPSGITYSPGKVIQATKYTDSLYTVIDGGATYYLPVAYIASIAGGDDVKQSEGESSASIGEIVQGEKDENYSKNLFSYTIPSSGLWLYRTRDAAKSPALSLSGGKVIQLSEAEPTDAADTDYANWYTTWYGTTMYYIPRASLYANSEAINVGKTMSIVLQGDITLYTSAALTQKSGDKLTMLDSNGKQRRINVTVASLLTTADKNALPPELVDNMTRNYAKVYSTVYGGKTQFFPAYSSYDKDASATVDPDEMLDALLSSNTQANLMTRFTVKAGGVLPLYANANDKTSGITVVPTAQEGSVSLYGIKYDDKGWYRVMYNGGVWYLKQSDYTTLVMAGEADDLSQVAVAGDVASNSYTVTIGTAGASVYKTATALTSNVYYPPGSTTPGKLAAGATITATPQAATGWYACIYPGTGETVYFQLSGGNATTNNTARSYIIKVPDGAGTVPVYSTIATSMLSPVDGLRLEEGQTYTLRVVNDLWSSVTLRGGTFYVRNSDIPQQALEDRIAVSSTTVGKTYTITLGHADAAQNTIDKFSDSKLSVKSGTIPAGTTLSGTKLYVEDSNANSHLVFQVNHNGVAYVDSKYVIGVKDGDEADEAKEAENLGESAYDMDNGEARYFAINAGTKVYESMSLSADTILLPVTATYLMTRMDKDWLRLTYSDKYYYLPISDIEPSENDDDGSAGIGASIPVGTVFMHTLTKSASAYDAPSYSANIVGSVSPNVLIRITKVAENWYEYDNGSVKVYMTAAGVFGTAGSTGTDSTATTTDGIGIITPTIRITGASGTVNLRRDASTRSTIMERVPVGTTLSNGGYVVDDNGQVWYKVSYNGKTGYVVGTYVAAVGTVGGGTSSVDPSVDVGKSLRVDVSSVNIRSGAGTKYSIIGRMQKGDVVVPTGYVYGDDNMIWYKFQFSAGKEGYIRYDYVSGGIATNTELTGNVAIKQGGTNLRSGAGSSFSVKSKLERDTIVTIVGSGTDKDNLLWYRVTYLNLNGYVRSDLVRPLTASESGGLFEGINTNYTELKHGSKGDEVLALQNQLIKLGYLAAGQADGTYGVKTTEAVKAFQTANSMSVTGVASPAVQAAIFNKTNVSTGSTNSLDWFGSGFDLLNLNKNLSIYDINTGITWNARYVEGKNHADVVPATAADAQKLVAYNITGSYIRRPVLVNVAGQQFAGSMYAVGHGTQNFVSFFSGVMCLHFTGSKTHGTGNVDADHQAAINEALQFGNSAQ